MTIYGLGEISSWGALHWAGSNVSISCIGSESHQMSCIWFSCVCFCQSVTSSEFNSWWFAFHMTVPFLIVVSWFLILCSSNPSFSLLSINSFSCCCLSVWSIQRRNAFWTWQPRSAGWRSVETLMKPKGWAVEVPDCYDHLEWTTSFFYPPLQSCSL